MKQCCNGLLHSMREWMYTIRQNPLLLAWNICTILSVWIPLITYWSCRVGDEEGSQDNNNNQNNGWSWWWNNNNNNNNDDNNDNNNGGSGDNEGGWWYNLWFGGEERRDDEQRTGALVFVYLWTLVMFVIICGLGHRHILNNRDNPSFLAILVMFANLSFVACLLTACTLDERMVEEGGFFGTFTMCMVFTYALWTFLCSVFCGILYKPSHTKEYDSSASHYQRQTDTDDNTASWWGGTPTQVTNDKKTEMSSGGGWGWPTHDTTPGGSYRVKTAGEDDEPMTPMGCMGSETNADKRQGSMV